ncbi:MAG TPA: membrane protein insertion efficiency factor YidD [Desulfobacteraceae bacterium]|nr:membrane protein insertion efficiency factor YidD [Geoalkalibacter subterraneus]HDR14903.1 membrane protein insertion efficiency factor YidD [Desulfobacteraceae bacterium]
MMRRILLALIRFYQICLSPLKGPSCRFYPTCSEYSFQAIRQYGILRGVYLGCKRLAKCHPFHPGGYDPLP